MSVLMNVLRSAFSPRAGQAPAEDTASAPAAEDQPPAWRLLGAETGVQDLEYGEHARPMVQRMFRQPPRRVLDIGCASGAVGAELKQSNPGVWVWGCELNEKEAKVAASRLDHVTTVARPQWSVEDLARVKTVDTVLLFDVLEHMYNPWAELEFLAQNLPADAQVLVSLPNIGHLSVLQGLSTGTFPYAPMGNLDITHVRFFTRADMLAMFEQTGFKVDEQWVLKSTPNIKIDTFPKHVSAGKLVLTIESAEEWERLNAVQFGFRLTRATADVPPERAKADWSRRGAYTR